MSRTIIVGDVHGCAEELEDLLDRVAFARGDRLLMVGDLVMRGPDSRRVIELVASVGGTSVRGNHEDRLLRYRARARGKTMGGGIDETDRRILASSELSALAASLDDEAWAFVKAMPLFLERPEHDLLLVHAGVIPGRPVAATAERTLLYLRNLRADGSPSERRDDGELWGLFYDGPPHVCFGHNARSEPQIHPWATGLDTGCVYGGRLTALVLAADEPVPRDEKDRRAALVAVPARRAHAPIAG